MNKSATKIRDSKFEILRIIAIFLIIAHHYAIHGFHLKEIDVFSYNRIIVNILSLGGKLGVNLFVLISSYFMVDSKFKFKKLIKLFGETWIYSITILILFTTILTPVTNIGIKQIIKSIFPIVFCQYWFITDYILLMILSPFLNDYIKNLDAKSYKKLLITLIVIEVLLSGTIQSTLVDMSNPIIWFTILYLTAGYIKQYVDLSKNSFKVNLTTSLVSYLLLILSVILLNVLGHTLNDNTAILNRSTYFMKQNSIFIFVTAVELFITFVKLPTINNTWINKIASCSLGIYLIHDNPLMREYLWKTIFKNQNHYFSSNLLIYSILTIFTVYLICMLIDLIRQATIEKIYLKITDKVYNKVEKRTYELKTNLTKKLDIDKIL